MADEAATETRGIDNPPPPSDPFDLGDTSLALPERDPSTGRFLPAIPVPPEEQPAPAPVVSKHPAYLLGRAREFGLSDEEINDLSTPALDRQLWRLSRAQLQLRADLARQSDVTNPAAPSPLPLSPAAPVAPVAEEEPDLGLDESQYDPEFLKAAKAVNKATFKKLKELDGQLKERDARDQQRETRDFEQVLDAAFARLGADYESLFGKGAAGKLAPQGVEMKRRVAVLNAAGIRVPADVNRHTLVAQLKEAADAFFPKPAAAPKPDGLGAYEQPAKNGQQRITPEQWNEAAVARPSARQGAPEPKGRDLAVKNLSKKLAAEGVPVASQQGDTEILDTLLG